MKKIAIVTGASSGLGKEFARALFLEDNIDELWLLARRIEKLDELKKELTTSVSENRLNAPFVRPIEIDLSGRNGLIQFKALVDVEKEIDRKTGGFEFTYLINNAGFGTYGTFETTPMEKELDMIDINCVTLTGLCSLSLEYMKKDATIINVASLGAFLPLGNFAVYAATKSYVLSFTMGLAAEVFDKGIKVLALCPGPVSTEFAKVASNGKRPEVLHGLPAKKVVLHCLKKAKNGKHMAVMALKWKLKAFLSRFVGRYFGARFTYKYCKRPS